MLYFAGKTQLSDDKLESESGMSWNVAKSPGVDSQLINEKLLLDYWQVSKIVQNGRDRVPKQWETFMQPSVAEKFKFV